MIADPKSAEPAAWRCDVTGHPVDTDTRMVGAPPCDCQGCRAYRALLAERQAREAAERERDELGDRFEDTVHASVKKAHALGLERHDAETARQAAEASLAEAQARIAELEGAWQPADTAPKDGTRVRLLLETEAVFDAREPALLMGGWRRVTGRDKVFGWAALSSIKKEPSHGI